MESRQLSRLYRLTAFDVPVWSCSIAEDGVLWTTNGEALSGGEVQFRAGQQLSRGTAKAEVGDPV
jgi:hypothetical protein